LLRLLGSLELLLPRSGLVALLRLVKEIDLSLRVVRRSSSTTKAVCLSAHHQVLLLLEAEVGVASLVGFGCSCVHNLLASESLMPFVVIELRQLGHHRVIISFTKLFHPTGPSVGEPNRRASLVHLRVPAGLLPQLSLRALPLLQVLHDEHVVACSFVVGPGHLHAAAGLCELNWVLLLLEFDGAALPLGALRVDEVELHLLQGVVNQVVVEVQGAVQELVGMVLALGVPHFATASSCLPGFWIKR